MARKRDDSANQPQWKSGWTMANGYYHEGYWYVRHKRKLVSLTRYGAPSRKGGKRERNLALTARDKFLSEQATAEQAASQATGTRAVADVLNYYAMNYVPTQAPSTQRISQHYLKLFATGSDSGLKGVSVYEGLGRLPAEDLTEGHLLAWKQSHPKWGDDKPLKTIKAAFAYAVRKGFVRFNPIKGAETVTTQGHAGDETFFFSDQEEAIFRANILNPAFRQFFSACIETGARPGELAVLQPRHIKEVDGKVFWRLEWEEWKNGRKTKKPRIIALPERWQTWSRHRRAEGTINPYADPEMSELCMQLMHRVPEQRPRGARHPRAARRPSRQKRSSPDQRSPCRPNTTASPVRAHGGTGLACPSLREDCQRQAGRHRRAGNVWDRQDQPDRGFPAIARVPGPDRARDGRAADPARALPRARGAALQGLRQRGR